MSGEIYPPNGYKLVNPGEIYGRCQVMSYDNRVDRWKGPYAIDDFRHRGVDHILIFRKEADNAKTVW